MRSTGLTARRSLALVAVLLAPLALWGGLPLPSHGADAGSLENRISSSKQRERTLASAAERLGRLERLAARDVALLEGRLAEAQASLDTWSAKLATTRAELRTTRRRALALRLRLERDRAQLADMLRAAYMTGRPDLTSFVLSSQGFAALVDRLEFLRAVARRNGQVVADVRRARRARRAQARSLQTLVPRQRRATEAVRRQRDGLAQMAGALRARRAALTAARVARQQALSSARSDRRRAERELDRLTAQRSAAAVDRRGPGGPWAIPWAIVQCESGGQNLPPNYAGASGYYQFIPSTWRGLGGSTPHAYLASKAEQDRLAARLWAGGSGARNWDCAAIVGLL
jgi:peptidoglycan hydrolase CwlO-like protein